MRRAEQHFHLCGAKHVVGDGGLEANRGDLQRLSHAFPKALGHGVLSHFFPGFCLPKFTRKQHQLTKFFPLHREQFVDLSVHIVVL